MMYRTTLAVFILISFFQLPVFGQKSSFMAMSPEARVTRIVDFLTKEASLTKDQESQVISVLMAREEARQAQYSTFLLQPQTEVPIDDVGNPFISSLEKFHAPFDQQLREILNANQFTQLQKMRQVAANQRLEDLRKEKGKGFFYDLEIRS